MKSLYELNSYKVYLKLWIDTHKRRGLISEMAEAAGCNRTYLSQVINGNIHLTPDHIVGLSIFLGLNPTEQDYLLHLNLYERAANRTSKQVFFKKLEFLRKSNFNLKKSLEPEVSKDVFRPSDRDFYYRNPNCTLIHLLTSTKQNQTLEEISKKISLPEQEVLKILEVLIKAGLVTLKEKKYYHSGQNIHIESGSIHNRLNHLNWRMKASENFDMPESIHYTNIFSLSKEDRDKLKQQVLELIEKQRQTIISSGSEDLFVFCCDFFEPLKN